MTKQMGNKYNILSLEAKDIFYAMQTGDGYRLPKEKDDGKGKRYFGKFANVLDWSLDSEMLEQVWTKTNRKKSFRM